MSREEWEAQQLDNDLLNRDAEPPHIENAPSLIDDDDDPVQAQFYTVFQFASLGVTQAPQSTCRPWAICLCCQLSGTPVFVGPLQPAPGSAPVFAQIWFLDENAQQAAHQLQRDQT